ncbi:hypothetical protein AAKU52_002572 [Pedobacter sp. CG_S7]|uniref:hypothetical protein n=1 Tax=Pedobacter sp. CG_S7 TaxID=3143930 RepID=UPI0033931407
MEKPNSHPKPSEDIQLNIETVTPDTEKEGLANDQKNKKEGIDPVSTLKEKESIEVPPSDKNIDNEDDKDEPDAGSKIETVSP